MLTPIVKHDIISKSLEAGDIYKHYGMLEKRLNSPAFHAGIHGFESRTCHIHGRLAQLGERLPYKQNVGGSIPSMPIMPV